MGDVTKARLGLYTVGWTAAGAGAAFDHGYVDKVTPILPLKLKPLKIGSLGDIKLGDRVIGIDDGAKIQVVCREIDLTFFQKMMPWYTSGSIPGKPATVNKDLYDYAGPLVVHPNDVSGTTQDITVLKAVPLRDFMTRDGVADDSITVEYVIYPDRAQLPSVAAWFYVGAAP